MEIAVAKGDSRKESSNANMDGVECCAANDFVCFNENDGVRCLRNQHDIYSRASVLGHCAGAHF
jgi:hypothetical protein